ncbi:MAG TPA: hypothetical protein VNH11_04795 [Pirellulales bacterium]|nr:hypothetical protein [Pirellulales bacterium]
MESVEMGRTVTVAMIENLQDLWDAERGLIPSEKVRRVTVSDALADTGATLLSLPARLIQQLGLKRHSRRRVTSSVGVVEADMNDAVRPTIQGRDCTMDVIAQLADLAAYPLDLLWRRSRVDIGPARALRVASANRVTQEVKRIVRHLANARLRLVDRQLQPCHHAPHHGHRLVGGAAAADHEVIGIVYDLSA